MVTKTRHSGKRIKKKPSPKILKNTAPGGQVKIKYLFEHLNCPISIFDFQKRRFIYINQHFTRLTGLSPEECYKMGLDEFLAHVQSNDLLALQGEIKKHLIKATKQFINKQNRQLSYSMNCRFKRFDGTFSDIMVQCTVMEWDKNKYPVATLNLYTDLTPHKRDLKIILTINVFDEEEKQWKTVLTEEFLRIPKMLSKREHEIMKEMVHDLSADDISTKLKLTFFTVRAHWRNILSKTGCKSQKELKEMAQREGWV